MTGRRRRSWLGVALLLAAGAATPSLAAPGARQSAALAQLRYEDDADDFGGLLARGGVLFDYASPFQYSGVAVQNVHYEQDGWRDDVVGLVGLYRNQKRDTLEGIRAEAGVVSVGGKLRPVGDVTWSLRPRPTTGIELIAAGDVVGTRPALERGISYGLAAASMEQQFGERFTVVGLAGWQPFTDGNARGLLRARIIYSTPVEGFSLQARWRQYESREDDVDGAYFNPGHYRNWDAGLAWRRRVNGWLVSGLAGAGREKIDDQSWQGTTVAELRAEGRVRGESVLSAGLLYSRAAGFHTNPDYWYAALNVTLTVPLR
jgi:hypothetical protein